MSDYCIKSIFYQSLSDFKLAEVDVKSYMWLEINKFAILEKILLCCYLNVCNASMKWNLEGIKFIILSSLLPVHHDSQVVSNLSFTVK